MDDSEGDRLLKTELLNNIMNTLNLVLCDGCWFRGQNRDAKWLKLKKRFILKRSFIIYIVTTCRKKKSPIWMLVMEAFFLFPMIKSDYCPLLLSGVITFTQTHIILVSFHTSREWGHKDGDQSAWVSALAPSRCPGVSGFWDQRHVTNLTTKQKRKARNSPHVISQNLTERKSFVKWD